MVCGSIWGCTLQWHVFRCTKWLSEAFVILSFFASFLLIDHLLASILISHFSFPFCSMVAVVVLNFVSCKSLSSECTVCFSFPGWYYRIWTFHFYNRVFWYHTLEKSLICRWSFKLFTLNVMKLLLDNRLNFFLLLSLTFTIPSLPFFLFLSFYLSLFFCLSFPFFHFVYLSFCCFLSITFFLLYYLFCFSSLLFSSFCLSHSFSL